jgi:hypothetical protein
MPGNRRVCLNLATIRSDEPFESQENIVSPQYGALVAAESGRIGKKRFPIAMNLADRRR